MPIQIILFLSIKLLLFPMACQRTPLCYPMPKSTTCHAISIVRFPCTDKPPNLKIRRISFSQYYNLPSQLCHRLRGLAISADLRHCIPRSISLTHSPGQKKKKRVHLMMDFRKRAIFEPFFFFLQNWVFLAGCGVFMSSFVFICFSLYLIRSRIPGGSISLFLFYFSRLRCVSIPRLHSTCFSLGWGEGRKGIQHEWLYHGFRRFRPWLCAVSGAWGEDL